MKKNIIILCAVLAAMPFASSCSDWIEEHPKAVAVDTFYNTKDDADAAIAAVSQRLRAARTSSAAWTAFMEDFSDYAFGRGSWSSNSTYELLNVQNKTRTANLWTNLYYLVRDANICISNFPNASELTDAQKTAYTAEARFYRAFAYFDLVRMWNNVPLRTEENMETFDMALTPSAEVWNYIIEDLKYAVANCPDSPVLVGRPCKNAARALLADVYLTQQKYSDAKPLLSDIITSNAYSLVQVSTTREFDKIFGYDVTNSTEEIFYSKTSRTNNSGWEIVMYTAHPNAKVDGVKMHGSGGWYALVLCMQNKWIEQWDSKDLRKNLNVLDFGHMDNFDDFDMNALSIKFYDPEAQGGSGATCDNPIYRYADVLMMYAECLGCGDRNYDEALKYLNMIHRRGYGYPPLAESPVDLKVSDCNTPETFLKALTKEQCYEFWGEGKRWPFLRRTGQAAAYVKEYKNRSIDPNFYLWPIPENEFTYNKALDPSKDQNPGY